MGIITLTPQGCCMSQSSARYMISAIPHLPRLLGWGAAVEPSYLSQSGGSSSISSSPWPHMPLLFPLASYLQGDRWTGKSPAVSRTLSPFFKGPFCKVTGIDGVVFFCCGTFLELLLCTRHCAHFTLTVNPQLVARGVAFQASAVQLGV